MFHEGTMMILGENHNYLNFLSRTLKLEHILKMCVCICVLDKRKGKKLYLQMKPSCSLTSLVLAILDVYKALRKKDQEWPKEQIQLWQTC